MTKGLRAVLADAQANGAIGPASLSAHIEHAREFARALTTAVALPPGWLPATVLDLGSGGGLPGLVLATETWPVPTTLLEANGRRAVSLRGAASRLGVADRVDVQHERAEVAGRMPALRGRYQVVVARGFGPPSVTAECAAPFLVAGGWLVVSEPPEAEPERWVAAPLRQLGLGAPQQYRGDHTYVILSQERPCPERYPRRTGVPAKRPLF